VIVRESTTPVTQVLVVPALDWAVAAVVRDAVAALASGVAALGCYATVQVLHALAVRAWAVNVARLAAVVVERKKVGVMVIIIDQPQPIHHAVSRRRPLSVLNIVL
jgi:hypothetical protein